MTGIVSQSFFKKQMELATKLIDNLMIFQKNAKKKKVLQHIRIYLKYIVGIWLNSVQSLELWQFLLLTTGILKEQWGIWKLS